MARDEIRKAISIHAPRTGSDVPNFSSIWSTIGISIHAPRTGSDNNGCFYCFFCTGFQSTLPARGATFKFCQDLFNYPISIHAPRTGSDITETGAKYNSYISIHAPRTGSDIFAPNLCNLHLISIHAPRTGSDVPSAPAFAPAVAISIHAPRTGSDAMASRASRSSGLFQSTLPARGATAPLTLVWPWEAFQSTLPARGATVLRVPALKPILVFQSTLPARGATSSASDGTRTTRCFNPRSPHGERRR